VRRATLPLYAGGFLGPFGGAMLVALIPSVAGDLDTTVGLVAVAITAYMVPFALLQLVSGTLGERFGAGRVVRTGYVAYGAAALGCALAPSIELFIGGRAVMGAANAFLSPLLLAALSEKVPSDVLGRSVGTFAAAQVAGLTLAPVLGGALGEVSWRLAFGLVAGVSAALAAVPLGLPRALERGRPVPRGRARAHRWIGLVASAAFCGYLGFTAIGFVVALVASEDFGLGPAASGLVVAAYGVGGILLGRVGGIAADRAGRPLTAIAGGLGCAAGVLGLAFAPSVWILTLLYFAIGCGSAFAWAGLNTIAVESFPENRAGAVSAYSAFKFVGVAVAPIVYVPLLDHSSSLPFVVATGFTVAFAALVVPWLGRYRVGARTG
jgi:MFS family permease